MELFSQPIAKEYKGKMYWVIYIIDTDHPPIKEIHMTETSIIKRITTFGFWQQPPFIQFPIM